MRNIDSKNVNGEIFIGREEEREEEEEDDFFSFQYPLDRQYCTLIFCYKIILMLYLKIK